MPSWPTGGAWPASGAWPTGGAWPTAGAWPSGSAPVTPLTIFQTFPPLLWVRSDLGVTNVANVCTVLADQSGHGNTMIAAGTGPNITTADATLNNRQTFGFANLTALWTSLGLALAPPFAYRLVFKPLTWNSAVLIVGDGQNANRGQIAYAGGSPNVFQDNGSFVNGGAVVLGSQWYRVRSNYTNSAADSLKLGSAAPVTGANAGAASPANVGMNMNGGLPAAGTWQWAELVVMGGIPTGGEDTAFDAYVSARYTAAVQV